MKMVQYLRVKMTDMMLETECLNYIDDTHRVSLSGRMQPTSQFQFSRKKKQTKSLNSMKQFSILTISGERATKFSKHFFTTLLKHLRKFS